MIDRKTLQQVRGALLLTLLLVVGALAQFGLFAFRAGILRTSWKWQLALGALALGTALLAAGLFTTPGGLWARLQLVLEAGARRWPGNRALNLLAFLALLIGLPVLLMGPGGGYLEAIFPRLLAFWLFCLAGAGLLAAVWPASSRAYRLAGSAILLAAVYQAALFRPDLSTYPLSMGWSEVSRFYYGSLFLAEKVYGLQTPPSVLHPSRYLLQAVPFLLDNSPLWLHRLWQVALWLGLTLWSAALLARRLTLPRRTTLLVTLWSFLFFFQGPVLYHLQVCVIVVLAGYRRENFWRTTLVVVLASIWAGISRINWLPVPAFLAASLYFLETPFPASRDSRGRWDLRVQPLLRYLRPTVVWVLTGTAAGLVSQSAYILLSGNAADQFGSSFTSQLLWYRLLPSATYPLGVLPAALLVSAPVLALLALYLQRNISSYHPIRLLGLGAMGFVLFAGGVVVSTKIGGGSNLHNIDSYLLLLLVAGLYASYGRFTPEPGSQPAARVFPGWLTAAVIAVPVVFALSAGGPYTAPDPARAQEVIQEIKDAVALYRPAGGEVLFISERHLITFDTLPEVELVPPYEKVFLMEMAMSGNSDYLGALRADLQNRRFSLIVSHPLKIQYQGRARPFGEENDAWVRGVSEPVLCYYEPVATYQDVGVQLLVPRENVIGCP